MPQSPQFDAGELKALALPYDILAPELSPEPHFTGGTNMMVSSKGKLLKRPGTNQVTTTNSSFRFDRIAILESLDTPPVIYLLGSLFNSGTGFWELWYNRLDGATNWVTAGSLRHIDQSTRPHEIVISRGMAFIKAYPTSADAQGFKLGTVIFNPNSGSPYVTFWGLMGPTTSQCVAMTSSAGWTASNHAVTVNVNWYYTYAWKTRTGQVSPRAPLQTNPDSASSGTGPFTNKMPAMTVQGVADTTNIPTICIYRTTDGGGSFYKLTEITNTGAGAITFQDNLLLSGGGQKDPLPDAQLDTSHVSPSLVSNGPPPTCLADLGQTTGTSPILASTPIEAFAGRLWFAVGNVLFFSANEELNEGIPEESFPSGISGNFYRLQHPIVSLKATTEALYIMTTETVQWIRGTSLSTFQNLPLYTDLGAKRGHPLAITAADKSVVWLTHDYRIAIARGATRDFLSDPLNQSLKSLVTGGATVQLARFAEFDKDLLIINAVNTGTWANTRQLVFDFNQGDKGLWNVPWTIGATAVAAGQIYDTSDLTRHLVWASWNGTNAGSLTTTDTSLVTVQDYVPGTGATNYACSFTLSSIGNPSGNHLNQLRQPAMASVLYGVKLDRTKFTSDTDPTLTYYLDNITGAGGTSGGTAVVPPRRNQSQGYTTLQWNINQVCERVSVTLAKSAANERFECQVLTFIWTPDSGA